MPSKHSIAIQWSEEDKVFIASVPELPGLNAFGETPEEAVKELGIAKELFLQMMQEDGEQIPDPIFLCNIVDSLELESPNHCMHH
jgi:predicted RNase H-like HicB family nuclease